MTNLFTGIIASSVQSSIVILIILGLKKVFKGKVSPKWHYLIWLLLIIQFCIPHSLTSVFKVPVSQKYNLIKLVQRVTPGDTVNNKKVPIAKKDRATNLNSVQLDSIKLNTNNFLLIGSGIFFIYMLFVNLRFHYSIRKQHPLATEINVLLADCKDLLSMRHKINLNVSNDISTPMLVSIIKPTIILPKKVVEQGNFIELKYILLHELIHARRYDLLINTIWKAIICINWFNPLVWYAYYKMLEDQEISCDAAVLHYLSHNEAKGYGYSILKFLARLQQTHSSMLLTKNFAGGKSLLKRRIIMLKIFKKNTLKTSLIGAGVLTIGLALTGATVAMMKPDSSEQVSRHVSKADMVQHVQIDHKEIKDSLAKNGCVPTEPITTPVYDSTEDRVGKRSPKEISKVPAGTYRVVAVKEIGPGSIFTDDVCYMKIEYAEGQSGWIRESKQKLVK